MSLRENIKKFIPSKAWIFMKDVKADLRHFSFATYDYSRFSTHSGSAKGRQSVAHRDAEITKIYHAIEKGLALPTPRPGFGTIVVDRLLDLLTQCLTADGEWTPACQNAINALDAYLLHAQSKGVEVTSRIRQVIALAASKGHVKSGDAVKLVTRQQILEAVNFDSERFFRRRHSIRNFKTAPLDRDRLASAIDLARTTPSVCNRQSSRVLVVPNENKNFDLLRHQNGNRGFGNSASAFLAVVSDLRSFVEPEERYQAWIDGGMFSMSLVLALHAKGFGTCCLNWSNTSTSDRAFRLEAGIPDYESVIMLIAVGELPEELVVANSDRLPAASMHRYL